MGKLRRAFGNITILLAATLTYIIFNKTVKQQTSNGAIYFLFFVCFASYPYLYTLKIRDMYFSSAGCVKLFGNANLVYYNLATALQRGVTSHILILTLSCNKFMWLLIHQAYSVLSNWNINFWTIFLIFCLNYFKLSLFCICFTWFLPLTIHINQLLNNILLH